MRTVRDEHDAALLAQKGYVDGDILGFTPAGLGGVCGFAFKAWWFMRGAFTAGVMREKIAGA